MIRWKDQCWWLAESAASFKSFTLKRMSKICLARRWKAMAPRFWTWNHHQVSRLCWPVRAQIDLFGCGTFKRASQSQRFFKTTDTVKYEDEKTTNYWQDKHDLFSTFFQDVVSIDFNNDCSKLVSSGTDHRLIIWNLQSPEVATAIEASRWHNDKANSFKTVYYPFSEFETRDIHNTHIDCVKWFGELIISKVKIKFGCFTEIMLHVDSFFSQIPGACRWFNMLETWLNWSVAKHCENIEIDLFHNQTVQRAHRLHLLLRSICIE